MPLGRDGPLVHLGACIGSLLSGASGTLEMRSPRALRTPAWDAAPPPLSPARPTDTWGEGGEEQWEVVAQKRRTLEMSHQAEMDLMDGKRKSSVLRKKRPSQRATYLAENDMWRAGDFKVGPVD